MGFLAPWFLAGMAVVGLPIYLHLLRRHATTPRPFSSLRFFERRQQSSIRHRRLRYLLLLSLRLALLVLLVLAFANPFVNRTAASVAAEKLMLLVVDDSVSMRAGTRLADARRQALDVLSAHKPTERIQIASLGAELHLLTLTNDDDSTRRAAIASIEPGDSRGSFGEFGRAIRLMAEGLGTPVELHLFSDLQRSKMPPNFSDVVLPSNVTLVLHPVVDGSVVPNWTVESVTAPGHVWGSPQPGQAVPVQAVIAGYATSEATRTATLVINGKTISTRTVKVPAGGRAAVQFPSLDVPYGFSRCEVRIDSADALAADDVYRFAVERSDPPKALFVHGASDSRSPLYVGQAVAAAPQSAFALQPVTPEQAASLRFSDYAFVVLSNVASLPVSVESALTMYVRGGGSVMVAMGTAAVVRARIPVFGDTIQEAHNYGRELANGQERFVSVGEIDRSHPSVDKTGSWSDVRFYFAVRVEATDARVVARLTDQTPLILDKKIGEGHVLLFASGFDNLTNDLPLHPAFVPFIEESAQYLAGIARTGGARVVDSYVELRSQDVVPAGKGTNQASDASVPVGVEVIDPNGKRPLSLTEAATARSFRLTEAGFYQVRMSDRRQDVIGVNPDRRASNLEVLPAEAQALWRGGTPAAPQASPAAVPAAPAENVKKAFSLWWYVMILVLAAALLESWLASRYLSVQADES
jgi:hypothetical protein